jgi:hypothetical protein
LPIIKENITGKKISESLLSRRNSSDRLKII